MIIVLTNSGNHDKGLDYSRIIWDVDLQGFS